MDGFFQHPMGVTRLPQGDFGTVQSQKGILRQLVVGDKRLVIGKGHDGIAMLPVTSLDLLHGPMAVGNHRVGMEIGLVLLQFTAFFRDQNGHKNILLTGLLQTFDQRFGTADAVHGGGGDAPGVTGTLPAGEQAGRHRLTVLAP